MGRDDNARGIIAPTSKAGAVSGVRMASAISRTIACECAFCAAEMTGELIRNLSEELPLKGLAPVFGVEPRRPGKTHSSHGQTKKGLQQSVVIP